VANAYNAQLRLRKISESVLDEFPGIGPVRKAALLKHFGSVQRLRQATVEEIAEVPGFGPRLASELRKFLDARNPGNKQEGVTSTAPADSAGASSPSRPTAG
jgi:excinuclease ABC subunit C